MPAPTADQVANAYALNLAPATNALNSFGETLARNQQLAEQKRKQLQANQLQGLSLINDATSQLEKGTGYAPFDDMTNTHIADAKSTAMKMLMAGADPISMSMTLDRSLGGLRAKQADVTRLITNQNAVAKAQAEQDPTLDPSLLARGFQDKTFYSTDAKGNKVFNQNFDPSADYTQGILNAGDEALDPFRNRILVQQHAATDLPKLYAERQSQDVQVEPGITASAKIPAYLTINPQLRQTVYDFKPITLTGENGQQTAVPVLRDDNIVRSLYQSPNIGRHLRFQERELRKSMPSSVSDDDIKRIVATDFVQIHGTKPGGGVQEDDSELKRAREARRDAESSFYKAQANARGNESLHLQKQRMADAEQAKVKKYVNSPFGVATLGMIRAQDLHTGKMIPANPDQYQQLHNHDEWVKLPGTQQMWGTNINSFSGKASGLITEPGTGRPVKVHYIEAPGGGGMLTYQYLQKKTTTATTDGTKTSSVEWVPSGEAKIIHPDKFKSAWEALAPQLGLNPGKYDAAYNEQPDDVAATPFPE